MYDVEPLIRLVRARNLLFMMVQLQIVLDQSQAGGVRLPDDLPNAEHLRVMEMPVKSIVLAKTNVGPIAKHHGRASLAVAVNEKHAISPNCKVLSRVQRQGDRKSTRLNSSH